MLMLFLSVRSRINFLQLARHSGQYCEHLANPDLQRR